MTILATRTMTMMTAVATAASATMRTRAGVRARARARPIVRRIISLGAVSVVSRKKVRFGRA
eukprot:4032866-Lingulodinium_polyedra.AAC.1